MDCESMKDRKTCNACERENETETATHWCFDCTDSLCEKCALGHKKYKPIKYHRVMRMSELGEYPVSKGDILTCSKHAGKKLEAFCADHNVSCCITCVTIEHRKCESVFTVESVAEEIRSSKALEKMEKELLDVDGHLHGIVLSKSKNITQVKESSTKMKEEIQTARLRINAYLDKIQGTSLEELSATEKEIIIQLEGTRSEVECHRSVISNCLAIIRTGLKNASDAQLLVEYEKLKTQNSELKTYLKRIEDNSFEIQGEISDEVHQIEKTCQEFCKIEKTERCPGHSSRVPNINMLQATAKAIHTVYSTITDAYKGCYITQEGTVLLAHEHANKLELFDQRGKFLSHLDYNLGNLWCVEMKGKKTGVFTSYKAKTVVFFNITDDAKLVQTNQKNFSLPCYDIRHYNNNLYLACESEIKVLDMNGNETGSIAPLSSRARFLDINSQNKILCYSSNANSNDSVTCIKLDGTEVFRYTSPNLRVASGVSIDFAGNIYVVGNSSGNIHQLTSSGQYNKTVVSNLRSPYALRFKRNSTRFITTDNGKAVVYEMT